MRKNIRLRCAWPGFRPLEQRQHRRRAGPGAAGRAGVFLPARRQFARARPDHRQRRRPAWRWPRCRPTARPTLHPALVVGARPADLRLPPAGAPGDAATHCAGCWPALVAAPRRGAWRRITARGLPFVPERRRQPRLDLDLTDPAEYIMRRKAPPRGAVLIIDKGGAFRDHVARAGRPRAAWPSNGPTAPPTAVRLCDETPVSVVMVNTSTPRHRPVRAVQRDQAPGRRRAHRRGAAGRAQLPLRQRARPRGAACAACSTSRLPTATSSARCKSCCRCPPERRFKLQI